MLFDQQMTMTPHTNEIIPISQPTPSYSISQHYNHSSHVASSAPTPSITTESTVLAIQNIHNILRQHGLDPEAFSPAQLELFKNADPAQQERLIQTWQFYSSSQQNTNQDFEMDESTADSEFHGENAEPYMVSGYEGGAGRGHSLSTTLPAEPSTGKPYESSTDPVYSGQQWWEMPRSMVTSMESQYGLFEERNRYISGYGMV